jgi:spermidine/putrescine transport system permease protein
MAKSRILTVTASFYILLMLAFLYASLVPLVVSSFSGNGQKGLSFETYRGIWGNAVLLGAMRTSLRVAVVTAVVATPLAVLAAIAVREFRIRRLILLLMILPLFIPGVSMGLADAFFFRQLHISPSLFTIVIVHVLWTTPFAFLIVLTGVAAFDPVYLEAAYVHGANRMRAFMDVELPLIRPAVMGAAVFSFILSLNETVRTTLVQGNLNTVQTYIWSTYLQVGLSPTLYALMSLFVLLTLGLVLILLLMGIRRVRALQAAS